MPCILQLLLVLGDRCGILLQWLWRKLYLMVIVFPYTLELAVYKGFFPMASAVILSELQVGFNICLDYSLNSYCSLLNSVGYFIAMFWNKRLILVTLLSRIQYILAFLCCCLVCILLTTASIHTFHEVHPCVWLLPYGYVAYVPKFIDDNFFFVSRCCSMLGGAVPSFWEKNYFWLV